MSLQDFVRSVMRRWYIFQGGLLVTALLGFAALALVPPKYDAEGYVALMPGEATFPQGSNPFLYLGGGTAVRDILVRVMSADDVQESVLSSYPDADFSVAPDPTGGPLLLVTATAPTSAEAVTAMTAVMEELPSALDTLQDSRAMPDGARFTPLELAGDQEASINRSSTNRAIVLALALGIAVTVLATSWLDGFLLNRRAQRRAGHATADDSAGESAGEGHDLPGDDVSGVSGDGVPGVPGDDVPGVPGEDVSSSADQVRSRENASMS